ncbi:MAG: hypothetical protein ABFC81_08420, partial [Rectinema sp.]
VSGLRPTQWCDEGTVRLLFYEGTQPVKDCDIHKDRTESARDLLGNITDTQITLPNGNGQAPAQSGGLGTPDSTITVDIPGFSY